MQHVRHLPGLQYAVCYLVFESYVAPILVLMIAMWYKEEQGRWVSWFYVCNSLTTIFGSFLAYGVSFAKTNFASWRIFFHAIRALTYCRSSGVCVPTRFAGEGETVHKCRKSGRSDESEGESEVS